MTARAQIVLLLLAVTSPTVLRAQVADTRFLDADGVTVLGVVLDVTTQRPLNIAEVRLIAPEPAGMVAWRTLSDSLGTFHTPRLAPGDYRLDVTALGYTTASQAVTLSGHGSLELRVEIAPEALLLDPVIVTAARPSRLERNGFYDRRNRGLGRSITRLEMESRGMRRIDGVFRMMGGVTVSPTPLGGYQLRMRGGCRPDFVMDGVRMGPVERIEDVLSVDNLEGIEVFGPGSVPPQYSRSTCGTVLAWSREPGVDGDSRPFSWGRLAAAAGFVAIVFLISF